MNEQMLQKLEELVKNEAFADSWSAANSKEERMKLLSVNGIEISDEEYEDLMNSAAPEEIPEEELSNVAGGIIYSIPKLTPFGYVCPRCKKRVSFWGFHLCLNRW
ncbi:MAG: hypothetical protein IJ188_07425 [Clostridia bacterium]|nr:hypothetical protein [Clostridia bacterium]